MNFSSTPAYSSDFCQFISDSNMPLEFFALMQHFNQQQFYASKISEEFIQSQQPREPLKKPKNVRHSLDGDQEQFLPGESSKNKKKTANITESQYSRKQKSNRNIKSNILKYFIKYIMDERIMNPTVQMICQVHNINLSYQEFQSIMQKKFKKNPSYVRPTYIRQLCFGVGTTQEFAKVLRISLRKFLSAEFQIGIQASSKINRQMKYLQISAKRGLLNQILSLKN